ncbi:M16 family metallopeptidase [Brumimicrobium aurantiacum]|uniref:Insulinase family protein n=1 Tax=Brumimicrobium aurantiacum TaxID=1737063 RepID=A0A3E1EY33_9FLAO|nr:pitrilysin family protein [Brumimicrobium aurantiacum]RFC54383.1 insulinase family protein [Brumimicrobium aurantiacum]
MINRTIAPETKTVHHIDFQSPEIHTLNNKVNIYSMRKTDDETVRVDFVFDAGSLKTSKIIAQLTGELLLSGTGEKSSDEIEEAIDRLGGFTGIEVSTEKATISAIGLREHIISITKTVVDAIINVNFNPKEINQLLQSKKKKMAISLEKVSTQARRAFLSDLFKNSPYGDLTQLEDYDKIEQNDLIEFHQEKYLSGLQYIKVVGAISEEDLKELQTLGERFSKEEFTTIDYDYGYTPNKIHIEKEQAVQTAIRVGRILFNKTHTDFIKFSVVNTILGGYFGSRLMTSIREDKGYTYGIGSGVAQLKETGYFFISTEVGKEFKDLTLEAIAAEITLLQTEEVSEKELSLVKNYIIGQILEQSDGAQAMMDRFISVESYGLDFSYYDEFIKQVNAITPAEVKELANLYLNWEDFTIVSAG